MNSAYKRKVDVYLSSLKKATSISEVDSLLDGFVSYVKEMNFPTERYMKYSPRVYAEMHKAVLLDASYRVPLRMYGWLKKAVSRDTTTFRDGLSFVSVKDGKARGCNPYSLNVCTSPVPDGLYYLTNRLMYSVLWDVDYPDLSSLLSMRFDKDVIMFPDLRSFNATTKHYETSGGHCIAIKTHKLIEGLGPAKRVQVNVMNGVHKFSFGPYEAFSIVASYPKQVKNGAQP